jgi:hypothetical protein
MPQSLSCSTAAHRGVAGQHICQIRLEYYAASARLEKQGRQGQQEAVGSSSSSSNGLVSMEVPACCGIMAFHDSPRTCYA